MTLQIRAIPRHSGVTGSRVLAVASCYWYHDITNPGNPQTTGKIGPATHLWYHDITNPGNPQTPSDLVAIGQDRYHDITNPGNPQTLGEAYRSLPLGTMTLQIRAIPRQIWKENGQIQKVP